MHTQPDIHYCTGLMPALIGWVGRVVPRYWGQNTFQYNLNIQLVEIVAPFNFVRGKKVTNPTSGPFPTRILTSHKTRALFHTVPLSLFLYYSYKILFIQKEFVV